MTLEVAKHNMISQQLRTNNVHNDSILQLLENNRREDFVPSRFRQMAYSDAVIPIGHGQTMMTPLEEALIIQSLNLNGHEKVLEIGTGTGYLTSLLAQRANFVHSIDYFSDFTQLATQNLSKLDIQNLQLSTGDACHGWMESAPYDAIVVTAGMKSLHESFRPQLMKSGVMFAIIGQSPIMQGRRYQLDESDNWHFDIVFETDIAALINKRERETFQF